MDGKQLIRTLSGENTKSVWLSVAEYLALFGVGILAILLHARLRTPLNMPGHHGLEFMALLMAGRVVSKIKWASSISSLGIGFILLFPVFGFKDPFMGVNFMIPGLIIDIIYNLTRQFKWQLLVMALSAGIAYLSIPISRFIIHLISGFPYTSFLKFGYVIPMINHFLFGLAGGFLGAGVTQSLINKIKRSR